MYEPKYIRYKKIGSKETLNGCEVDFLHSGDIYHINFTLGMGKETDTKIVR